MQEAKFQLIKFEDGEFSLDVNVSPTEDTVWLTQAEMAFLFQKDRKTITTHIRNILNCQELEEKTVCSFFEHTATDGKIYNVKYNNLDMIISVGYRVNSKRGILFRKWATSVLKQYMIKGYSINTKRCIECQDNLLTLNNKVEYLLNQSEHTNSRLFALEKTDNILIDKLFYEDDIFDAYSYIKQLFLSAKSTIIIIDQTIYLCGFYM